MRIASGWIVAHLAAAIFLMRLLLSGSLSRCVIRNPIVLAFGTQADSQSNVSWDEAIHSACPSRLKEWRLLEKLDEGFAAAAALARIYTRCYRGIKIIPREEEKNERELNLIIYHCTTPTLNQTPFSRGKFFS